MLLLDLPLGYELRQLRADEFRPLFKALRPKLFGETLTFNAHEAFSAEEQESQRRLQARMGTPYELYVGLYHHGEIAGWTFGRQVDSERFYMVNSAVLPEHRQKGLYKAMLKAVLHEATKEGFQIVYSRHVATNSVILVPKLKAGFVITGFEVSDTFGILVHLSYFTNPLRRKALDFRAGQRVPDAELRRYLPL